MKCSGKGGRKQEVGFEKGGAEGRKDKGGKEMEREEEKGKGSFEVGEVKEREAKGGEEKADKEKDGHAVEREERKWK